MFKGSCNDNGAMLFDKASGVYDEPRKPAQEVQNMAIVVFERKHFAQAELRLSNAQKLKDTPISGIAKQQLKICGVEIGQGIWQVSFNCNLPRTVANETGNPHFLS